MNIFKAVKENVTPMEAAKHYGLKVTRKGMCVCPFHNDKNPSIKIDDRIGGGFYCFGCLASGDVITLTEKLFGISKLEAAKKLAEDFRVSYEQGAYTKPTKRSGSEILLKRKKQEEDAIMAKRKELGDRILHLLSDMREEKYLSENNAMKVLEDDETYVWIVQKLDMIEDLYDQIADCSIEELKRNINEFEKAVMNNVGGFKKVRDGSKRAS